MKVWKPSPSPATTTMAVSKCRGILFLSFAVKILLQGVGKRAMTNLRTLSSITVAFILEYWSRSLLWTCSMGHWNLLAQITCDLEWSSLHFQQKEKLVCRSSKSATDHFCAVHDGIREQLGIPQNEIESLTGSKDGLLSCFILLLHRPIMDMWFTTGRLMDQPWDQTPDSSWHCEWCGTVVFYLSFFFSHRSTD